MTDYPQYRPAKTHSEVLRTKGSEHLDLAQLLTKDDVRSFYLWRRISNRAHPIGKTFTQERNCDLIQRY